MMITTNPGSSLSSAHISASSQCASLLSAHFCCGALRCAAAPIAIGRVLADDDVSLSSSLCG